VGKEKIAEIYSNVRSRLTERGKAHAFHFLADDDWVMVEARGDMVTTSGAPYQNQYCLLYRLDDDLIVEVKEYQDTSLCERLLGPYPQAL
jgi:ketosteroid isomerase-like protein